MDHKGDMSDSNFVGGYYRLSSPDPAGSLYKFLFIVHRCSVMKRRCTCILTLARTHTHRRRNRDASLRKFRRWRRVFIRWFARSFFLSFLRSFVRPSARWYWPCNWAQTLSSARPAKDYTPACPEGPEPNVLV